VRGANDPSFYHANDGLLLVVQGEGAGIEERERTDNEWALEIAQALDKAYPGHPWLVSFQGGALIVRHIEIAHAVMMKTGRSGFGSVLPPHRMESRKAVVESAVKNAGEMLECFRMPRGAWSIDYPPVVPDWRRGKSAGFT
jgi:hypothetical protein